MKFQILSILFIISTILINFKFVESQQYQTTYYVQNNGSDAFGCGYTNNPCQTVFGALSSYYRASGSGYYVLDPLTISMGPSTTITSTYGQQPFTLNGFNVTIVGSPDGSTYMFNNGYTSLFNTTYSSYQNSVTISFVNITYGSPYGYCSPPKSYYGGNPPASLFTIIPQYSLNSISVAFNNFTYNCGVSYANLIQVTNGGYYTYNDDPSYDWNVNQYQVPSSSSYPGVIINLNGFIVPSTHFSVELINSTITPTTIIIKNSQFGNSNQSAISYDSSVFLVGRGFVTVESSVFNVTTSDISVGTYVFNVQNVQFNNKNTNISIANGGYGQYLTCNGCFYTAYNVNVTALASNSATFVFSNGAASFYNSYFYSEASSSEIISASSSQLSIRTSILISTFTTAIEMDGVDLSMFYNQYSSYFNSNYNYYTTYYPAVHCSSSSQSTILTNEGAKSYGIDCDQYESNQKVKWAFVYMAVGIGGIISMFVFLFVSIAIIKRCGGE